MNNNDIFIFVAGVIVGLILAWLYRRRSTKASTEKEDETKENFSSSSCNTKCSKSSGSWANLKESCDRLGGKYEKCGDKDIFGNKKGRRCAGYTDPNFWDGSCNSIDERWL